ncbi:MAG: hypothetical protein WAL80_11740 [Xanthobacteraceae bacterium]
MAYVPDWERLSDALKRVMAAGVPEDEAKLDISRQIADRKIRVRLTIAEQSVPTTTKVFADWNQLVAEAQGLAPRTPHQKTNNQEASVESNECFEGANVKVPPHLTPADFDWENSRPLKPWPVRPRGGRRDEWRSFSPPAVLIELSVSDIRNVLCGVWPTSVAKIEKPARGRPADYNWTGVKARLETYASQNGAVKTLNELLQKCADFASELHPRKRTPSDKTIREAIKRHALGIAAGIVPGNSPGK